jgi:hypothetical protein
LAGFACAVGCALPRPAPAATIVMPVPAADRRFTVLYEGEKIGAHTVLYSPATGETRVSTDIHMLVKMAFFTLSRFTHHSQETWRDGRLVSLRSVTVEYGKTLRVEGAATTQGFRVVSQDGPFIASAATLTSNSLWTPVVLAQRTVIDAQHGGIIGVSARRVGEELVLIGGREIQATRYALITPYIAGSIWYDRDDLWVHAEFERDGTNIQYRLDA